MGQRIYTSPASENLAGEQMATANQTAANQLTQTATGAGPRVAGSFSNMGAHMAALPSFLFVLLIGFLLFFLVFHSHLSLAASLGVGKK